jgi:signal peptidase I
MSGTLQRVCRRLLIAALLGMGLAVAGCGGDEERYTSPSAAMEPTIHCARPIGGCEADSADTLVVESLRGSPERGDILVFDAPLHAERTCGIVIERLVKRVVALPGETWEMRDGYVFIDGERLAETYVTPDRRDRTSRPPRRVPAGMLVVMGDNRSGSCDSRMFGPVPVATINGEVVEIERAG